MIGFALCRRGSRGADDRRVLRDTCEFGRDVLRRQDQVDGACGHRTARHRVVAGGVVLREGNAPLSLDGLQAHRAVGGSAGENHPYRTVALIIRQRLEKAINRAMRCPRPGPGGQLQHTRGDAQIPIGWNDVDVIRLDAQIVRHLVDWEGRGATEQLREGALVHGIEMLYEHETHARIEGEVLEQYRERLEPAGGRADSHDRKRPRCP
jgi:hypothetical protein